LLDADPDEATMQLFFESCPHALLHEYQGSLVGARILTQLRIGDYRSDFAYLSIYTGALNLNLIEIESPRMRCFRKDHHFTEEFNTACQQPADWSVYVKEHRSAIISMLARCYANVLPPDFASLQVNACLTLIAGRRREVKIHPTRQQRLNERRLHGLHIRSYDRVLEDLDGKVVMVPCHVYSYSGEECRRKFPSTSNSSFEK
jgi:hypothetical protein